MKNNKGVSLVELSIAIAIIGLLLSAVTEGFRMRKSAEIRGFLTEISTFQIAIDGFDLKYRDLPGDIPDAFTYWGVACATTDNCNGNGDGKIDLGTGADSEAYRSWQHLVLSEFIGGSYTGTATTIQADIGINIPASKRIKVGYSVQYSSGRTRNEMTLGAIYASNVNTNGAVTPLEAFTIDRKLDDGIPGSGRVYGIIGNDAGSNNCILSSAYAIAVTHLSCILTFPIKP